MAENQNYSELKRDFASFINTLDAFLVKDTSGSDFMIEFVDHALKDGAENPLKSNNKSNEARFLNNEKLPKPRAEFIKDNFDRNKLQNYLEELFDNEDNEDSVNDLCHEFFPNNENITFQNLAGELVKLFQTILRNRILEKDTRRKNKNENYISLEEEKEFEEKIKETVTALCAIKSGTELKEKITSPALIERKIHDDFFLQEDVRHKVTKYYALINQCFVNEQREGAVPADFISKTVNSHYKELKKQGLGKQEIFDLMAQFFLVQAKLPQQNLRYVECVVAYFVQLCEVFDAAAE